VRLRRRHVHARFFKLDLLDPDFKTRSINPESTQALLREATVAAPAWPVKAWVAVPVWSAGAPIAAVAWSIGSPVLPGAAVAQWSGRRAGEPAWRRAYRSAYRRLCAGLLAVATVAACSAAAVVVDRHTAQAEEAVVVAQVPPSTFRIRCTLRSRRSLHTRHSRRIRASRSIPHIRRTRESRRTRRSPDIRRSLCTRSRIRRRAACWDATLRRLFCRRHKTSRGLRPRSPLRPEGSPGPLCRAATIVAPPSWHARRSPLPTTIPQPHLAPVSFCSDASKIA
jgi:hypothetical protein